jgi:hypothetical protein
MIRQGKAMEGFEKYYADNTVMMENDQSFDTSFCEQFIDVTFKDDKRMKMDQVSVRTWKDGKIVKERFVYNGM